MPMPKINNPQEISGPKYTPLVKVEIGGHFLTDPNLLMVRTESSTKGNYCWCSQRAKLYLLPDTFPVNPVDVEVEITIKELTNADAETR